MGRTVGVHDSLQKWTWYIHGGSHVAQFIPATGQQSGLNENPVATLSASSFVNGAPVYSTFATQTQPLTYFVYDHLGSTRVSYSTAVTAGLTSYTLKTIHDYKAYGDIAREYVNGTQDKYQFTGYERDGEIQLDYALARMYDRGGRFMGVDALRDKYPGWSGYNYCMGNPVMMVDPMGTYPGNYYDQDGNKVATDNIADNKIYVVGDNAEARAIKKAGGIVEKGSVKSALELPSHTVRRAMSAVIEMDKNDPYREYGGVFGLSEDGSESVTFAQPGPRVKLANDPNAQMVLWNFPNNDIGAITTPLGTFHTHPGAVLNTNKGLNSSGESIEMSSRSRSVNQTPSSQDYENQSTWLKRGSVQQNAYMLGMGSQRVSIYNGTKVLATFPLSKFFNL